jgi:hypothetical protein
LDSLDRPLCSRKRSSLVRKHALSIRLRQHTGEQHWLGQTPDGLFNGRFNGFVLSLPFVASDAGMLGASAAIFAVAA